MLLWRLLQYVVYVDNGGACYKVGLPKTKEPLPFSRNKS